MTTATEFDVHEQAADPLPADPVTHLARCVSCDVAVKFYPSASGSSFIVLDTETSYGISANGLPLCPNGHGEMSVADEQLPAEEAIAKDSKKAWEKAADLYNKMALELRRRRLEKSDPAESPEAAADPRLVRCTYEQAHPDMECPICLDPEKAERDGYPIGARDSQAHDDQAAAYEQYLFAVETQEALEEAGVIVPGNTLREWTTEQLEEAKAWAEVEAQAVDPSEKRLRPAILGTSHIAADPEAGADVQACRECGAVVLTRETDVVDGWQYPAGTLVGVDCAGPGQAYPKKTKKSSAKKK